MSTSQIAPRKRQTSPSKSRFQHLWAEAEAMSQENAELEKALDALVGRVDREVLAAEREMGLVIRQFVYRQLGFAQRKSLLKWQRDVLNEWIDENLSHLEDMGLLDADLQNEIARLRAFEMGITLDDDGELSPAEQLDAYFSLHTEGGIGFSEGDPARHGTADLFDDEADGDVDYDDDDDRDAAEELEALLRRLRGEFDDVLADADVDTAPAARRSQGDGDKVFKRLFRQTAAALHPDRENDATRREEKHALMSQLLQARKEHDLITIVALHERHVDAESGLSSDDEQELEAVLVDYLNQQRDRQEQIIWRSPMHHMAYEQFYDKQAATVTRRIRKHVRETDKRRQMLVDFLSEVKTLKVFKEVLAARHDSRMMSDTWR